jgi:hypothetical protein
MLFRPLTLLLLVIILFRALRLIPRSFVLPLSSLAVGPSPIGIPASVASNGEFPVNQSPFSSVADISSFADNFVATYGPPSDFLNDLPVSAPAKSPLEPKPRGIKEC